jgi:hydroxyacylglutathione hydrolase
MIQRTLPVGPLQCNCQILVCPDTFHAVVVDPGDEPTRILETLRAIEHETGRAIEVKALFHTHAHFDHIGGTRAIKESLSSDGSGPGIFLHRADEFLYSMLPKQAERFGFRLNDPLPIDRYLEDEERLAVGSLKFSILHTPGHSPGGVCFRLHSDTARKVPETVFTGDTLFRESIGRSDLWGGDEDQLIRSIRTRLLTLDDDTRAWPGHGPASSIGHEKRKNSYV